MGSNTFMPHALEIKLASIAKLRSLFSVIVAGFWMVKWMETSEKATGDPGSQFAKISSFPELRKRKEHCDVFVVVVLFVLFFIMIIRIFFRAAVTEIPQECTSKK